jgi:hypothetical protein
MRRALTGGRCQCAGCGLYFTGTREFDRHRTGEYAKPGEWKGMRRCIPLAGLEAKDWREDARGFLMQGRLERAPAGVEARNSPSPEGGQGGAP